MVEIDPSIIPTAFLSTCVIFVCFTLTALYSERRAWLYLGGKSCTPIYEYECVYMCAIVTGMLFSGLMILFVVGFVSIFMRSELAFQVRGTHVFDNGM